MGPMGKSFKQIYRNQKSSFSNKRNTIKLANYICNLKDNNTDYKIEWEILNRTISKSSIEFGCQFSNL